MSENPLVEGRVQLDLPKWKQDNYVGRAKHFFTVTDPRNILLGTTELEAAKELLALYRVRKEPAGTTVEDVFAAKRAYASSYHPETGDKMWLPGRMSFQVPGNMVICGLMMTFYRTTPAVLFWQWVNQSFNAVVNYTNRSGKTEITQDVLIKSYVTATSGAVVVALGLNRLAAKLPPLVGRLVPFTAVCAANCINIPMMRQSELLNGIDILDEEGNVVGQSSAAARSAIAQVTMSRVIMATPGMGMTPIIMNALDQKTAIFKGARGALKQSLVQVGLMGIVLTFATPLACAIFEQTSSIAVSSLEPELKDSLSSKGLTRVYFNKGL